MSAQPEANTSELSRGRRRNAPAAFPTARDRTPPHNNDAEEGLLACCILDGGQESMSMCLDAKLQAESFYRPAHQVIFRVLTEFYSQGSAVDEIILADKLASRTVDSLPGRAHDPDGQRSLLDLVGGHSFLNALTNRIETTAHARYWLDIVREKWLLRRMIQTSTHIAEECYTHQDKLENFIDLVEQQIFAISQDRVSDSAQPLSKPVEEASILIQKIIQGTSDQGIMSGFTDLDKLTFGFQPTDMIVLAARPSMGKTAFALNIAENISLPKSGKGAATLMFSLEMGAEQLALRLMCSRAQVSMHKIRDGFGSREDQRKLSVAAQELKNASFWIDDSGHLTILELRAKARRVHARHPIDIIIVDYLQLLQGTDGRVQREQQIAEISRGIKALAKELRVPVLVLCQLNRESEKEGRPGLHHLRESGSIEQDADVVLILGKSEKDSSERDVPQQSPYRKLFIAKQRNGPVGAVDLTFRREFARFENYTSEI